MLVAMQGYAQEVLMTLLDYSQIASMAPMPKIKAPPISAKIKLKVKRCVNHIGVEEGSLRIEARN